MKEIGEMFLEKREQIGVKKEEVCSDLNITQAQLDNLENGSVNAFKDISYFKELLIKYSKYLSIDEDMITDKFNDFMFDFTSKISIKYIQNKLEQTLNESSGGNKEEIASPYTLISESLERSRKIRYLLILTVSLLLVLTVIIIAAYMIIG